MADAAREPEAADTAVDNADVDLLLALVQEHRVEELRRQLGQSMARLGLAPFLVSVVGPLNARIGQAWSRGQLEVFEEHLYTESIQAMIRNAIELERLVMCN